MNVLFTSSTRLDSSQLPIVGASSSNGFIPSRSTRIFIEKRKLEEIEIMTKANTQFDGIRYSHQHFIHSMNMLSCANWDPSSIDCPPTRVTNSRPSLLMMFDQDLGTTWTIADRSHNQDRDSNVVAASKLFKHIAT